MLLALAGCSPVPSSYPAAPVVELGSSADAFRPLGDGAAVQIVHGIQGGYHVWGAVRAQYVDPRAVVLRYSLRLDDGTPPLSMRQDVGDLEGTDDGLTPGVRLGTQVYVGDPSLIRGRACRLAVELIDMEGRTGSDSHRVFPVDGP